MELSIRTKREIMINAFVAIFATSITIEGILCHQNSDAFVDPKLNISLIPTQYFGFIALNYLLIKIICAIIFVDIGSMIIFYVVIGFVIHERVLQSLIFRINALYIISWIIIGVIFIASIPTTIFVYKYSIWLNFRRVGANLRIINAYVVRSVLKSLREVYFSTLVIAILAQLYPNYIYRRFEDNSKYRFGWLPLLFFIIYDEDSENKYRKIAEILLWILIMIETVVRDIHVRFSKGTQPYIFDGYLLGILVVYVILSIVDFFMYGSGLKEFYRERNKNIDMELE